MSAGDFGLSSSLPSDVDARAFIYTLEPIRQRQQWRLDKAQAALSRAQAELAETEAALMQVLEAHEEYARHVSSQLALRLDPVAHRLSLVRLSRFREEAKQLEESRLRLRDRCEALREALLCERVKLDGLDRHKHDALAEYAAEMRHLALNESDRDWLGRRSMRSVPPPSEERRK